MSRASAAREDRLCYSSEIGCGGRSRTDATAVMSRSGNRSSPHQQGSASPRRMVVAQGYDPCRRRPSARSRALIRRTRAPAPATVTGAAVGNRNRSSSLATKCSSLELRPRLVDPSGVEPAIPACRAGLQPAARAREMDQRKSRAAGRLDGSGAGASTNLPGLASGSCGDGPLKRKSPLAGFRERARSYWTCVWSAALSGLLLSCRAGPRTMLRIRHGLPIAERGGAEPILSDGFWAQRARYGE
jgi:hypothetical protein